MPEYLEFKTVQCKDCYRCVRECPVKAIEVKSHHAQIIEEHCILCGHCTHVCPRRQTTTCFGAKSRCHRCTVIH